MVPIHNGIPLSHKKEQNNAIRSNMDATRDSHTKKSKSEKERQIPYDIIYMWNLKYGTNEPIYKTETDSDVENRLVVAKGEGERVGWLGSLGLTDTNYCLRNGLAMKSCCVALGTTSSHLWWSMIMCEKRMCVKKYMCV